MATVATFLDDVTALAESGTDLLGDAKEFSLDSHAIPTDRVAAFFKIFQRFRVAFPAFFRKDHGFLLGSRLVIGMAGHAMDSLLGVL
jgi:hypothetical protein